MICIRPVFKSGVADQTRGSDTSMHLVKHLASFTSMHQVSHLVSLGQSDQTRGSDSSIHLVSNVLADGYTMLCTSLVVCCSGPPYDTHICQRTVIQCIVRFAYIMLSTSLIADSTLFSSFCVI